GLPFIGEGRQLAPEVDQVLVALGRVAKEAELFLDGLLGSGGGGWEGERGVVQGVEPRRRGDLGRRPLSQQGRWGATSAPLCHQSVSTPLDLRLREMTDLGGAAGAASFSAWCMKSARLPPLLRERWCTLAAMGCRASSARPAACLRARCPRPRAGRGWRRHA